MALVALAVGAAESQPAAALGSSNVNASAAGAVFSPKTSLTDDASEWLTTLNAYRSMADLGPVAEDPTLSSGAAHHSCYMLANGISHDEIPGKPGYTPDGDLAGNNGNVAVSSAVDASATSHIELWMTGPFHAIGILRAGLRTVGFGTCSSDTSTTPWHSGATLDVLRGLVAKPSSRPILWPGDGSTTRLDHFVTESPNPLDFCGWTGQSVGLPIIALMPERLTGDPIGTVNAVGGATMDTCVLTARNTTGVAQQILAGDNAVVVIPRVRLPPSAYAVTIVTNARTTSWTFTVDPSAAPGAAIPLPVSETTPIASGNALRVITPARVVDTRSDVGSTTLVGGLARRIQITGRGGVAGAAMAVTANFTTTGATERGYLTLWNCAAERPVVSTVNFGAGDTVPNGATVPLDATGGLCAYASTNVDLIVDVNGYFSANAGERFAAVTPARLMDSRIGLGTSSRIAAGTVLPLRVAGVAGVPTKASAVALNVTGIDSSEQGFVTVYPCDAPRPDASNLNPVPGSATPNLVITPVAEDGTVCLYTMTDVDLVVDITGYVSADADLLFTSTMPFRLTDTRDQSRGELNNGTGGNPVSGGQVLIIQVAGRRGIAATARAVSVNFTLVGATVPGFLTAWPCGARPATSSVNYAVGNAIANGAHMPLSASGQLCIFVLNSVHVIIDVNGWWSS